MELETGNICAQQLFFICLTLLLQQRHVNTNGSFSLETDRERAMMVRLKQESRLLYADKISTAGLFTLLCKISFKCPELNALLL